MGRFYDRSIAVSGVDIVDCLKNVPARSPHIRRISMSDTITKKFTLEIDAQLYNEFVAVAERNGHYEVARAGAGAPVLPAQRGSVAASGPH